MMKLRLISLMILVLPLHQAHAEQSGWLESGKLWVNIIAEDENKVRELLESFPIADFITYNVHKLTFHNSINFKIPEFSLN